MKILCVIDHLGPGGAQRQLVQLATGFKEKGHDVSFLTYHHIPFFNRVVEQAGIGITCIEEKNYLRRLFKMRRFIRKGNFDGVLSFLERASFISEFAGLPRRRWRMVAGERNASLKVKRRPSMRLFLLFHLFADYVVANSEANIKIVRSLNPLLPASRCRVIYNIIDFNRWKPDGVHARPSEDFRSNGSPLRVLVAARVQHQKNLKGLVDALMLMDPGELERIRIHWYGRMPEEAQLDRSTRKALEMIRSNGLKKVIRFYPPSKNIEEAVSRADAVGLFSLYEGLPNSICEGMAMAKPALCAKVSDIPQFLSHEPRLLFDPREPRSIAGALRHLIGMDSPQLQKVGLENERIAQQMFNRESIVSEYLELLGA